MSALFAAYVAQKSFILAAEFGGLDDRSAAQPRCHCSVNQPRGTQDAVSIACFPLRRRERGHFGAFGELGHPFVADGVRSWPSSRSTAWLTHRYRHRSTPMLPSSSIGSSRPLSLPRLESCTIAGAQRSFLCRRKEFPVNIRRAEKRAHIHSNH
jgi:hypothetical protein